jgi:2-C-methyl-D-erythritol 4-phosphate cytidylyltransferase
VVAIVPVGGVARGELLVAGQPVLRRTLSALAAVERLREIVVVAEAPVRSDVDGPATLFLVEPGTGRLEAISAALASASPAPRILIHEGDRPLTTARCVEAVLTAADGLPAAVAAVPARSTLKRVVDGLVVGTAPRERLHQVRTPAVFDRSLLEEALARGRREGWGCADELALSARAGIPMTLVPGDPHDVPISVPDSVPFAELVLAAGPSRAEPLAGARRAATASDRVPGGKVAAVVVAAGSGRRMGAARNKIFLPVMERPILAWTLDLFQLEPEVQTVVLVAAPSELEECRAEIVQRYGLTKVAKLVPGGRTRHESERSGIEAVADEIEAGDVEVVLVHDAVRPFTEPAHLRKAVRLARGEGAAVVAVRARGLVLASAQGTFQEEAAGELWAAQTPQAFGSRLLLEAHRRAAADGFEGTDTASVVERAGQPVHVVEGSYDNLKITTAEDLLLAEEIARRRQTGRRLLTAEVVHA